MSAVLHDYGLGDETSSLLVEGGPFNKGKVRRVWELVQVSADPTVPGHFYAVQKLIGSWVRSPEVEDYQVVWQPRGIEFPTVTRLIYGTLDDQGQIINLNSPQKREGVLRVGPVIPPGTVYTRESIDALMREDSRPVWVKLQDGEELPDDHVCHPRPKSVPNAEGYTLPTIEHPDSCVFDGRGGFLHNLALTTADGEESHK